jgi:hypothetical protein
LKYAVFTFDGYGLPIAWQLQQEGFDVVVAQVEDQTDVLSSLEENVDSEGHESRQRRLSLYDGMLEKRPACKVIEMLRKAKDAPEWFAFFDLNHLFRFAEEASSLGVHGNFPTGDDFCFEIDRELAKDFVDQHYPLMRVAQKRKFESRASAKGFLEKSEDLWVLKGLEEDARTVVPDVADVDLARGQILDALAQHPAEYESAGFLLELLIPGALELTPSKVYYDGEPVYTAMCIENKQLGAGNVGPMTDCAQDLVFSTEMEDKINKIAFPPIVDEMAKKHRGAFFWDASIYADPRTGKLYFGEFCANRPGYNSVYTEITLAGGASKYFESLVKRKNPHSPNEVGGSVRLFNLHRDDAGQPLTGGVIAYKPKVDEGLWLTDGRQERGRLVSAGYKPDLGVMTGVGHSVSEAAKRAYRSVDEFSFEGAYYRPQFDFLSREYKTSLLNRLEYGLEKGLYRIGFGLA